MVQDAGSSEPPFFVDAKDARHTRAAIGESAIVAVSNDARFAEPIAAIPAIMPTLILDLMRANTSGGVIDRGGTNPMLIAIDTASASN